MQPDRRQVLTMLGTVPNVLILAAATNSPNTRPSGDPCTRKLAEQCAERYAKADPSVADESAKTRIHPETIPLKCLHLCF